MVFGEDDWNDSKDNRVADHRVAVRGVSPSGSSGGPVVRGGSWNESRVVRNVWVVDSEPSRSGRVGHLGVGGRPKVEGLIERYLLVFPVYKA